MKKNALLLAALPLLLAGTVRASGSSRPAMPMQTGAPASPEDEAKEYLNDAITRKEKADKLEAEALAAPDAPKREKLLAKSQKEHEASIKKYVKATEKDPTLYGAWGGLGYAYRKTRRFDEALAAYDKSLALNPSYMPAVEYRAEAYLGLNRLEEVKAAYLTLFNSDRKRADELAAAIDTWVAGKKTDPSGLDAKTLDEFATWAAQRKQIAGQTSSLLKPRDERW